MTAKDVLQELSTLGSPSIKKVLMNHGAKEPFYGVRVGDLKPIQKRIKKNHELALALYDSGVSDAMYLAGLIAEPAKMTKAQLQKWVKGAYWYMLSEYTVAWTASESPFAVELANEWIKSPKESIAATGWATYSSFVAITPDEDLDLDGIERLLARIPKDLADAPNRVRYTMNGFVISVGGYVTPLLSRAKAIAKAVGKVEVDMGGTACKVPDALSYIEKIEKKGRVGRKRKTAIC
jgi:3-methyladenine DNA glycosylase AlkD